VVKAAPILVAPLAVGLFGRDHVFWALMGLVHLLAFLFLALLCHGELYRRRPAPARLTEFYLWVSAGGVIGGIFAALISPYVFTRVYEYPILIAAALLAVPGFFAPPWRTLAREALPPLVVAAAAIALQAVFHLRLPAAAELPFQVFLVALAALALVQRHRPARFFGLVVLGFVLTALWQPGFARVATARGFFGVHQVVDTADGRLRLLYHGTTMHGAQRLDGRNPPDTLTYYYPGGPIAESIATVRSASGGVTRVAVVGLGTGSLACHKRGDEQWTFFEIDPDVVRIARNPDYFTFLSACGPNIPIVLGDARLTLAAAAERFDLIVLDAFSSDTIPVHLLTREALAGYLSRLTPGGAIVMHISNRHMALAPVVAAVAAADGLVTYVREDYRPATDPPDDTMSAIVAALARAPADLGELPQRPGWRRIMSDPAVAPWSDDYSDILGAILRKKFAR
jgi:hypothetical protein